MTTSCYKAIQKTVSTFHKKDIFLPSITSELRNNFPQASLTTSYKARESVLVPTFPKINHVSNSLFKDAGVRHFFYNYKNL